MGAKMREVNYYRAPPAAQVTRTPCGYPKRTCPQARAHRQGHGEQAPGLSGILIKSAPPAQRVSRISLGCGLREYRRRWDWQRLATTLGPPFWAGKKPAAKFYGPDIFNFEVHRPCSFLHTPPPARQSQRAGRGWARKNQAAKFYGPCIYNFECHRPIFAHGPPVRQKKAPARTGP